MTEQCPNCGDEMLGDGYTSVLKCPQTTDADVEYAEADSGPWYCSTE